MSTNPFAPPRAPGEVEGYRSLAVFTGIVVTAFALEAILLVSNNAATLDFAVAVGCVASGLAVTVVLSIHRRLRVKLARGALVSAGARGPRHKFL